RSAVFAPIPNLGLVVVDEEHDGSFKQDTSPRYHGRDLALMRGHKEGCPVLLGTATPSLESWANVSRSKMTLLRLSERVAARPMPEVRLLDLRAQSFMDPQRIFSRALVEEIQANLTRGEQTILLMNRRGFAAWILCRSCGEGLTCPACSVSYTWHRQRNQLECHYCGRLERLPKICPHCQADSLQEMGFGTERVEEILQGMVPDGRIARMDRDTTRGHALTRLLGAFRRREIDILVGTQMVAKGHDFPGVTLVGVLLAETGLRLPDFRAAERTFQLMTQIAGRAGRAERVGRVLVQTYMPEHYSLMHASAHASEAFLEDELSMREFRDFPPLSHLALFRVESTDQDAAWAASRRLVGHLTDGCSTEVEIQGPRLAPVERIKERWRIQILVRSASRTRLSSSLSAVMFHLDEEPVPSKVNVILDVDPHSFL
ncbi:MAG: primosomal protein N', partial [Myxococcota bacterium]|nr:primosomal protein N' [Myxococcota bacterium]